MKCQKCGDDICDNNEEICEKCKGSQERNWPRGNL